jgi:hypothetical protein
MYKLYNKKYFMNIISVLLFESRRLPFLHLFCGYFTLTYNIHHDLSYKFGEMTIKSINLYMKCT